MNSFKDLVEYVTGFVTLLTPVAGALALFFFILGLFKFILNASDTASHKEGKNLMIYGTLALFVMVAFLAIIHLGKSIAGTNTTTGLPLIQQN